MLGLTWVLGLVIQPFTATRQVLIEALALPYWAFSFVPAKIIAGLNWLMGWSIPCPIVPPPLTFAFMRPSAPLFNEVVASLVIWAVGSAVYGVAWHYVTRISAPLRKIAVWSALCAFLAVAIRLPWYTYDEPGAIAQTAERVGRVVTAPSLMLLERSGISVALARPGSSGPPIDYIPEGRGAYVVANFLWFVLLYTALAPVNSMRTRKYES